MKIIPYVDQILSSSKREREDLRSEHKKHSPQKKELKCLALSVNDEDEKKTRESPKTQASLLDNSFDVDQISSRP
jgi:hypothetical protein